MKSWIRKFTDRFGTKRAVLYIVIFSIITINVMSAAAIIAIENHQKKSAAAEYHNLAIAAHAGSAEVDFSALQAVNPDVRFWILSEGTGIDYPVVQGSDNDFYRNHLFSGARNRFGCLFIDAACAGDFSDRNTIIYGQSQFDTLYNYASQDYYELLPDITLFTPDGTVTILLYAGIVTDDVSEVIKTDFDSADEFAEYIAWLGENSAFSSSISVSDTDRLATLCAVGNEPQMVLVGKIQ